MAFAGATSHPLLASVEVLKAYDVGGSGYFNVLELNVTNYGDRPLVPVFLVYFDGMYKRWVVGSVPVNGSPPEVPPVIVIPPHSWRLVNISAPSPTTFIPSFTPVLVTVYNMSSFDYVVSPVFVTGNVTRPVVLNPCFKLWHFVGIVNQSLPYAWTVPFMKKGTTLSYENGLMVNGYVVMYQALFNTSPVQVSVKYQGEVKYWLEGNTLIIEAVNATIYCVNVTEIK
jgi:hypothetical protein